MPGGREYEASRLRELVLYICDRSLTDARFGAVKLNKILFYADFDAYLTHGQSITGARYFHLEEGPAPLPMKPLLEEMTSPVFGEPTLIRKKEDAWGYTKHRYVALRDANVDDFLGWEIAIIDKWIARLWEYNGKQVSDLSHETVAWRITHDQQEVPYEAALASSDTPTREDMQWLQEVSANGSLRERS